MAVTKAGGSSRAPSTRPASVARTILAKRTAKPYKTEQSRVLAKKKKLDIQTTHNQAPAGFRFLPMGTPDLADRCKEMSRKKGLPIYVVNAKPVSKQAQDPTKVSHHIHRIGHHFRSDILEDACQELGYTYSRGRYVKEADLAKLTERSIMARAMARHGLRMEETRNEQETDDQVRAAIKELFPKIPEQDLKEILRHAWAEGSNRVGTVATLDLPRRVQLAVIARIRHAYTDYDTLLRAFEWKEARTTVEPDCLRKLIEWRGENPEEDDNELEEVIRETIVIDDDDDDGSPETVVIDDDEPETIIIDDSDPEDAAGAAYNSDTSLEISHRLAADEDLGAESNDEHSKRFFERYQLGPRNAQKRDLDVRQKIGAARERLRNERAPPTQPEIVRVHVPETSNGVVEIGGQQYRRVPSTVQVLPPASAHQPPPPPPPFATNVSQHSAQMHAHESRSFSAVPSNGHSSYDRAVPSIEPQEDLRRAALTFTAARQRDSKPGKNRSRPASPEGEAFDKRRRVDYPPPSATTIPDMHSPYQHNSPAQSWHTAAENTVTSPERQPYHYRGLSWADVRHEHASHESPHGAYGVPAHNGRPVEPGHAPSPAPYDPQKPLLRLEDYHQRSVLVAPHPEEGRRYGFVDAQVAPIQYVPHPHQQPEQPFHIPYPPPHTAHGSPQYQGYAQPQVIYVQPQTPQPVHGAPAAVQQVPREPPPAPGLQQPYHGAPAQPPQYYYPR